MGKDKDGHSRWRFPKAEGIAVREDTGEWSEGPFSNGLLDPDDQVPEVWYQAPPADDVTDPEAWDRWRTFLRTHRDAGDMLRRIAVMEAEAKLRAFRRR